MGTLIYSRAPPRVNSNAVVGVFFFCRFAGDGVCGASLASELLLDAAADLAADSEARDLCKLINSHMSIFSAASESVFTSLTSLVSNGYIVLAFSWLAWIDFSAASSP